MGGDHDRLGKFLWDIFKDQIANEFRHHPNKDEILERIATSSFVLEEINKWFEEAAFYTGIYWNERFRTLAQNAVENGVNQIKFRVVNSGEESQPRETPSEDRRANGK